MGFVYLGFVLVDLVDKGNIIFFFGVNVGFLLILMKWVIW